MQQYAFFVSPKPNRAGLIIHDGKYLMYVRNDLDMVVRDSGCCDWDSADRKLKEFVLDLKCGRSTQWEARTMSYLMLWLTM